MTNEQQTKPEGSPKPGPRSILLMLGVAFLTILVPFLFWQQTWFGRQLNEAELREQLTFSAKPRKIQHALTQLSEHMAAGRFENVRPWYPAIESLASHEVPEVRTTVAWVMGQDNRSESFHDLLVKMLEDPDPLVRRNAALSLVRFGDSRGRPELVEMLSVFTVKAPVGGKLGYRLAVDDPVNRGTLLARIQIDGPEPVEVRSIVPGFVKMKLPDDGKEVSAGEAILLLGPFEEQVWEALRALYLVGKGQDVPSIEPFSRNAPHMSSRVRQQAQLTLAAIEKRSAGELSR